MKFSLTLHQHSGLGQNLILLPMSKILSKPKEEQTEPQGSGGYPTFYYLLSEWHYAFKNFGKIIILNGPTSSGKTTAIKSLPAKKFHTVSIDDVWNKVFIKRILSSDTKDAYDFQTSLSVLIRETSAENVASLLHTGSLIRKEKHKLSILRHAANVKANLAEMCELYGTPSLFELYEAITNESMSFICNGRSVVVEGVFKSEGQLEYFRHCTNHLPQISVLLYSDTDSNLSKCINRNALFYTQSSYEFRFYSQTLLQRLDFFKHSLQDSPKKKPSRILETISIKKMKAIIHKAEQEEKVLNHYLREHSMKKPLYGLNFDSKFVFSLVFSNIGDDILSSQDDNIIEVTEKFSHHMILGQDSFLHFACFDI